MELLIIENFRDKNNNTLYEIGQIIDFEEARAKELLSNKRNLVKLAEAEEEKPVKKARKSKA